MNCPLCAGWGLDPNCGHCLVDGVPVPAGYLHRKAEPIGERAWGHMVDENFGWMGAHGFQHIVTLATAATGPFRGLL